MRLIQSIKKAFFPFLLILFIGISSDAFAQENILDSLYAETLKDSSPKVKLKKELAYLNRLASSYPDSTIGILENMSVQYEKDGFLYGAAHSKSLQSWFLTIKTQYEQSHRLAHEALTVFQELNDSSGIALTLNRIGICNLHFGRLEEARKYMKSALDYFLLLEDTARIDMCYNNLGIVALEEENYSEGISYYRKSLNLRILQKTWHWIAFSYFNMGSLHLDTKQLDSANLYLDKSRETFLNQTQHKSVPPMLYLSLAELQLIQGDLEKAIAYGDSALQLAQEKGRTETVIGATEFLAKARFENGDYKKAYERLEELLNQKISFDSINNLAAVSEIEERYQNAEKERELIELRSNELEARNEAQRFKVFLLYILIFVLILGALVGYWIFKRRQKQKLNESSLKAKLSDMKLMALRAQMNPHFVFNCINTAQNFVLNAKPALAYDYLASFAKLLRLVLENSDQSHVSLEDEINQLQLYIELEAIRFDQKFEFEIEVDSDLENGVFEIPSMILQPFVENAIVHALVNKAGDDGRLQVSLSKNEDNILCIIEDNGVGRKRAGEIKKEKKRFYKSTALPNIQERLNILKQRNEASFQLDIIDLYQGDKASGTRIKLCLPLS